MQPYVYLQKVAQELDQLQSRKQIYEILDELEFLFEALDPEFQDLASDLITRLNRRLERLA